MNSSSTETFFYSKLSTGSSQSDLTVLNAIRTAILDIKSKPWMINYIYMDLLRENLATKYGIGEISKIKKWFFGNDLPVVWGDWRNSKTAPPFIAVCLLSEVENEQFAGLGEENMTTSFEDETDFISSVDINRQPFTLVGPFSPQYDSSTGIVTLPDGITTDDIFPQSEALYTTTGSSYEVLTKVDSQNFTITAGLTENFTNSYISFLNPDQYISYNFFFFDQIFDITCVTASDSAPLFWLTGLCKFILLKYRKDLLEKYNVGLSKISMGKSEILEINDTNVQLLAQSFNMKCRVETRVLEQTSLPIKGIQGEINIQSDGNPDYTLTEDVE